MNDMIKKSENEIIEKIKKLDKMDNSLKGYEISVFLWHIENAFNKINNNDIMLNFNAKKLKNHFSFIDSDRETLFDNNSLSLMSDLNKIYSNMIKNDNDNDIDKIHYFLYELSGAIPSQRFNIYRKNFTGDIAYLENMINLWTTEKDVTLFRKNENQITDNGFYITSLDCETREASIENSFMHNMQKKNEELARELYLDIIKHTVKVIDKTLDDNPDLRFIFYYTDGEAKLKKQNKEDVFSFPDDLSYCIQLFNHVQKIYPFKDLSNVMMWFRDGEDVCQQIKRDNIFDSALHNFAHTLRKEDEFNAKDFLEQKNIQKEKQSIEENLNTIDSLPKKDIVRL